MTSGLAPYTHCKHGFIPFTFPSSPSTLIVRMGHIVLTAALCLLSAEFCMTWGPMRGLKKATWKGDKQIYKLTSRLYENVKIIVSNLFTTLRQCLTHSFGPAFLQYIYNITVQSYNYSTAIRIQYRHTIKVQPYNLSTVILLQYSHTNTVQPYLYS